MTIVAALEAGRDLVRSLTALVPEVGLVLGSGLGDLANLATDSVRIPFVDIPEFPPARVEGHAGELVLGLLGKRPVAILSGRFHAYEGHSLEKVALPVRLVARLGAKVVILTNAAGGIRDDLGAGSLMLLSDHLNLMGSNPLAGPSECERGPRFLDLTETYSRRLSSIAATVARERKIAISSGVYAALLGPTYETPAEIRMLRTLGADAVGMSTVPEAIAARHEGVEVLGISLITNRAAGLAAAPLSHEEVIAAGRAAREKFSRLVLGVVEAA